jgi:hypothetical protein
MVEKGSADTPVRLEGGGKENPAEEYAHVCPQSAPGAKE